MARICQRILCLAKKKNNKKKKNLCLSSFFFLATMPDNDPWPDFEEMWDLTSEEGLAYR